MKRLNQAGSHIIAVAVGVLVVGVIAFAGYTVASRQDAATDSPTASAQKSSEINSTADLAVTANELDAASTGVDSDLNDSSLDADLNDLL